MPDHLAHGFAARAQIGARIEGFGALRKQGPDGGGDGQPQIRINIDTDLRLAVTAAIRTLLAERPETFDPRAYLSAGREAVREMVRHKIRAVLGSSGQA